MEHGYGHDRRRGTAARGRADELGLLTWRKSAASNPNGDCVELARMPAGEIAIRNSRDPRGPALIYTRAEIAAFLAGAKNGEFDDLAR